ncbi:MAG: DNA polymerase III subunit delta' [Deltaproteobacteria bacterium]|nr:DNA polymerase III subunit delta' [Deltaproteobacteria bacterium]
MAFADIYGHENQITILKTAMANHRIAHAYLFYGMAGIGKRTTALAFAKALNCLQPLDYDACDTCPSCRKAERKNHPDIVTVEAEGQFIRINNIRDIQNQMQFKPFEGARRVVMVLDADKMNAAAANALLKTLEEPSAGNMLILTTARFYQLPVTVLSRCQHIRFNPLPNEKIGSYLQKRMSIDPHTAGRLASASGGSIGRALAMNNDVFIEERDEIFHTLLAADEQHLLKMLFFIGDLAARPKTIAEKLNLMKFCFRDALVYRETGEKNNLINNDCLDEIKELSKRLSGGDILNNIKAVDEALTAIERNANKQLTLDTMMFRLTLK